MQLNIKILECSNIPTKSFLNSYCDYFMTFEVSGVSSVQNTKIVTNSIDPIFNCQFSFILNDVRSSILKGVLKTPTFAGAKPISFVEISLSEFEEYENVERSFEMKQIDDTNAFGGKVHLILQIAPSGTPAFCDRSISPMMGMQMDESYMRDYRSAPMMERAPIPMIGQRQYQSAYSVQNSMYPNNNMNQMGYGMYSMRRSYMQMNNHFVQQPQFPQQIMPNGMYYNTPC